MRRFSRGIIRDCDKNMENPMEKENGETEVETTRRVRGQLMLTSELGSF